MRSAFLATKFGCFLSLLTLLGCSVGIELLMPTPLLYEATELSPLDAIPEEERWNLRRIYYATNRMRTNDLQKIDYSNTENQTMSVGMSFVNFGGDQVNWDDLNHASQQAERSQSIPLSIAGIMEFGKYRFDDDGQIQNVKGAANWLIDDINSNIDNARDQDILIYVHGAKVNFYNASVFAAQLDHFMGRDMTSITFSWPTRQNIFSYVWGDDKQRAYRSAPALASLIQTLADNSSARRVHIVTWSAGGRLVTAALTLLRAQHPDLDDEQLREQFRLGTVYYAAADVPGDEFINALPAIHDMTQRIVVTGSSNDEALNSAKVFMGGTTRIGQVNNHRLTDSQLDTLRQTNRLEYIDLSHGRENRGFDITGHRYWFNHPWASSDMILTIRTDLTPQERGLVQGDNAFQWWMPDDYPERLIKLSLDPSQELRR